MGVTGLSESGYREAVLGEAFSSLGVAMGEGMMIIWQSVIIKLEGFEGGFDRLVMGVGGG